MKRIATCLVLAAAAALSGVPAADAAVAKKKKPPCAARGSITVARSVQARVYETSRGGNYSLVGCRYRTNKRWVLDSWFSCDCSVGDDSPAELSRLAGRFAAVFSSYSCGPPSPDPSACGSRNLTVIDLRSGKVRHSVANGGDSSGLLLKPNGSLAYVLDDRLIRRDSTGTAVLDEGPGIGGRSLAASSTRLYWMHGATPRTAPFD